MKIFFAIAVFFAYMKIAAAEATHFSETFEGPQEVWKSPTPSGATEDQLVLQSPEKRSWEFVYKFSEQQQANEFISVDIRTDFYTGKVLKKICNLYDHPVALGKHRISYNVTDMGKTYDPSCNDTTPPIGPRRVIAEWSAPKLGIKFVNKLTIANFIAGASENQMVYADFSRNSLGRNLISNIVFPVADESELVKEKRRSDMTLKFKGWK